MASVDCKQIDIWAAALHTGELEKAHRIRLMEHLDGCPACRRRADGVTTLVEMLRDEPARLPRHRVNAIWRSVEAASPDPASAPRPPARRRRSRLALALAAALALALALAVGLGAFGPSPAEHRPDPASSPELSAAPAAAPVAPEAAPDPEGSPAPAPDSASRRWEIRWVNGQASTDGRSLAPGAVLAQGERLQVGRKGRALLVGPSEVMVVDEMTSIDLVGGKAGASRVRLVRGQITVLTRDRGEGEVEPQERVEVAVGTLMVRPLGTVFSIKWSGEGEPKISLAEGKLEVISPDRTVTLEAPARLTWGEEPEQLTGEAGRKLVERLTSAEKRRSARAARKTPAPVASVPVKQPVPGLRGELRALERELLGGGKADQVRKQVQALLARPGAMNEREAPALLGLVADTYMSQGRYPEARAAYLRTWKRFPTTLYGMDSLYGAASMDLQQLHKPARARRHLEQYLTRYKDGRQREGAYYLLHRTLLSQGKAREAGEVSARYRAEFPTGQYRVLFK